ncbi:MAG TPA: M14 metallopeptidase family protein [Bryobacteraceae bacterium]|nr:M14 metallopeptidase family protein [Bryobacteraceae bacterium]
MRAQLRLLSLLFAAASFVCAAVPNPRDYFGHEIGADRTVLDWDKVVSYFQQLAKSSDRIRIQELGKSTEGRPFLAAVIAAPETLQHLDRYIAIQQQLADPRRTTPAAAEPLFAQGKAVVLITCSIHASELASTHTAVEFAYRILTEDKPRFRAILRDTIFLLVPSLNPDGVDIVTRWYRKTLGTPAEGTDPPELWHHYVGHDDNRDWYMFTQVETQLTISKLHNVWHPEIVYDVHQQGAFGSRLFVPPWLDPTEPNIDPILMQETNMMGTSIASDLTAAGRTGVALNAIYDFWTPSRHYQAFHGGMRLLTESASARLATPITVRPDQISETALGFRPREKSWNYLEPWLGGTWSLRDIIDYQLISWESCLYNAALHREELLRNFYRVAQRQVARTDPWGFVIPAQQRDPGATRKLIETLRFGMVEIAQAPDGSAVIPMHQPYGGWAKALLERQHYPEEHLYPGGPPKRPYDVTAQTLPLLMGVEARPVSQPAEYSGEWKAPAAAAGPLLKAADTDSWHAVNRAWQNSRPVWRDPATGDFSLAARNGWKQLQRPRIGLYRSWMPNMDEGWTRWLFEQFGFAYTTVRNADIQAGGLHQMFDVIVFPDQSSRNIESGYNNNAMPPEYQGGLGARGAEALREFAAAGGTLVFLNHASDYAIEHLGVAATAVTGAAGFYSPGSLLNVHLDARHPLAYGVPPDLAIWSEQSPAWETQLPVVARYLDTGVLASGWLEGEKLIAGKAAIVDAPLGTGHVVLFGMRPQYRGQSYLTFKMFFNALTGS